jgi:hypothetical protein
MLYMAAPLTGLMAQEMPQLKPGARVRVTYTQDSGAAKRVVGALVSVDSNAVTLTANEPHMAVRTVPFTSVERIEISPNGPKISAGRVAGGFFLGAVGGYFIGGGMGKAFEPDECSTRFHDTEECGYGALLGALSGAAIGAFVGSLAGAAMKAERWQVVSMLQNRQGMILPRHDRLAFSVTWRF